MQARIGRASIQSVKKSRTDIPRDTCCMCHVVFATHDTMKVLYAHDNGDHIALCYGHLMEIANRPGTWFPRLSLNKPKDFDLVIYLNQVRTAVADQTFGDKKTIRTLSAVTALLDQTQLSRYIGGTAEFFKLGFMPTKILMTQ